jgi:hypothetical protein
MNPSPIILPDTYCPEVCPGCKGAGRIFIRVNEDHRRETKCLSCLGYGRFDIALARTLSGEAAEDRAKEKAARKKWRNETSSP